MHFVGVSTEWCVANVIYQDQGEDQGRSQHHRRCILSWCLCTLYLVHQCTSSYVLIHNTLYMYFRAMGLCVSRGGRPGLPVPNSPYGLCGRQATLKYVYSVHQVSRHSQLSTSLKLIITGRCVQMYTHVKYSSLGNLYRCDISQWLRLDCVISYVSKDSFRFSLSSQLETQLLLKNAATTKQNWIKNSVMKYKGPEELFLWPNQWPSWDKLDWIFIEGLMQYTIIMLIIVIVTMIIVIIMFVIITYWIFLKKAESSIR